MTLLPQRRSPRVGSSLIEVMIALTVLATGTLVVFGHIANVKKLQDGTQAHELATMAANNLANLYAGAAVSEIAAWNQAGSSYALARTDDLAWSKMDALVQRGIVASNSAGLFDGGANQLPVRLEFAVGFYRALQNTNDQGGFANGIGFYGGQEPARVSSVTNPLYVPSLSPAANRARRAPFHIADVADIREVSARKPIGILVQVQELELGNEEPRIIRTQLSMVGTP